MNFVRKIPLWSSSLLALFLITGILLLIQFYTESFCSRWKDSTFRLPDYVMDSIRHEYQVKQNIRKHKRTYRSHYRIKVNDPLKEKAEVIIKRLDEFIKS